MTLSDAELLRRYVTEGDEAAYAEVVRRHLKLVYFAAWRRTGDPHLAEDIAQYVFTALARDAAALSQHLVLTGWLYTTTRFASAKLLRAERRRRVREQEAFLMRDSPSSPTAPPLPPSAEWEKMRPVVDAALDELGETDRAAVLLRFFEGRPFAEIGAALLVTEDAARMRVSRALEKLRVLLERRGIVSTSAAVSAALVQQGAAMAPTGLIGSVLKEIRTASAARTAQQPTFWKTCMSPKILIPLTAVIVVAGLTISRPRAQTPQPRSALPSTLARPITSPQQRAQARASIAPPEIVDRVLNPGEANKAFPAEVEQERKIRNHLRQIGAARDAFLKFENRLPESLADIVGPTKMIRELKSVKGEDYATVKLDSRILSVEVPGSMAVTLTTDGPQRRGPPTREETARWKDALASYLQSRPAGAAPRLPGKPSAPKRKGDVEFAGVMASGANHVFIIEDQNGATQWVKLGQRMGPYVVSEYRGGDERLILKNGDAVMSLSLRKTKPSAPSFDVELEIAFLALQEVSMREGWPASALSVQKPQPMPGDRWFVYLYRITDRNEQRVVPGAQIRMVLTQDGAVASYQNAGIRRPREN